ncbi:MAG: DUF262 domain-containing protein [Marinisporobacter sp.]|jgi:hypothetical protein|nr:DUF262 domain-containing protein [Marinisporobacter sp.]
MNEIILKHEEIDKIFKSHLKIESKVMSIDSIFCNPRLSRRIDYKPYYQRNYVWDNEKATYFIESILIGTEIPPLVFFKNKKIEIIDGRQRYETIKNFIDKKLTLTGKGLQNLTYLAKYDFDDLDEDTKNIFYNTQIRILEFSVVNEPRLSERKEDLIKKEIFRRYNSGITPLKKPEIERALFITDDLSSDLKIKIKNDEQLYYILVKLFLSERDLGAINKRVTLDKLMSKLRQLLILQNIPIKKYSYGNNRSVILKNLYEYYSYNINDFEEFYEIFKIKISILNDLYGIYSNDYDIHNKLIYECTFWMLNILEQESKLDNGITLLLSDYAKYIYNNIDNFSMQSSHFYKNVVARFSTVAKFINEHFNIDTGIYIDDYSQYAKKADDYNSKEVPSQEIHKLEDVRLSKPEPTSMTIDDISRLMNRNKFLIRPPYQRHEVINKIKSSALIESILLGIKLPPVFIYRRDDGIHEVIDGQQRLLSILGFIGSEFIDEENKRVKSEKNKFKLKNLRILSENNNDNFEDLDEDLKDKILDFNLSVVIIDEKLNPSFDSVDLFIRLNNKPYPVRENSFEMWNSYIDKDIICVVKENLKKHVDWFYLKQSKNDKRMANQELYITLVYLEYKKLTEGIKHIDQFLNTYQRNENINTRIKEKKDITKLLDNVTVNESKKQDFINCIDKVEEFILLLKEILLGDLDSVDLIMELNAILCLKNSRRTTQSFYSLWLILNQVSNDKVKLYRNMIKNDIKEIIKSMKNNNNKDKNALDNYKMLLNSFNEKYR